jgi:hypothetical protein
MKIDQEYLKSTIEPNSLEYRDGTLSYRVTEADDYFLIAKRSFRNFLEEKELSTGVSSYSDKNEDFEPYVLCREKEETSYNKYFKLTHRNFLVAPKKSPVISIETVNKNYNELLEKYYYFLKSL